MDAALGRNFVFDYLQQVVTIFGRTDSVVLAMRSGVVVGTREVAGQKMVVILIELAWSMSKVRRENCSFIGFDPADTLQSKRQDKQTLTHPFRSLLYHKNCTKSATKS